MKHVIGARFACDEMVLLYMFCIVLMERGRELGPVPSKSLPVTNIEEMDFFVQGRNDTRMFCQVVIQGGCPASLRSNDNEVRQETDTICHEPVR